MSQVIIPVAKILQDAFPVGGEDLLFMGGDQHDQEVFITGLMAHSFRTGHQPQFPVYHCDAAEEIASASCMSGVPRMSIVPFPESGEWGACVLLDKVPIIDTSATPIPASTTASTPAPASSSEAGTPSAATYSVPSPVGEHRCFACGLSGLISFESMCPSCDRLRRAGVCRGDGVPALPVQARDDSPPLEPSSLKQNQSENQMDGECFPLSPPEATIPEPQTVGALKEDRLLALLTWAASLKEGPVILCCQHVSEAQLSRPRVARMIQRCRKARCILWLFCDSLEVNVPLGVICQFAGVSFFGIEKLKAVSPEVVKDFRARHLIRPCAEGMAGYGTALEFFSATYDKFCAHVSRVAEEERSLTCGYHSVFMMNLCRKRHTMAAGERTPPAARVAVASSTSTTPAAEFPKSSLERMDDSSDGSNGSNNGSNDGSHRSVKELPRKGKSLLNPAVTAGLRAEIKRMNATMARVSKAVAQFNWAEDEKGMEEYTVEEMEQDDRDGVELHVVTFDNDVEDAVSKAKRHE